MWKQEPYDPDMHRILPPDELFGISPDEEITKIIEKRFNEGWSKEALLNICNSHGIKPYDIAKIGSVKLIKFLEVDKIAYKLKEIGLTSFQLSVLRDVLEERFNWVFDL